MYRETTVLIIGATSGIGAGLARCIHAQGKKVIATGRRKERLSSLAVKLPGLETSNFDISDLATLPMNITVLTRKYPDIDTVIVNASIQSMFSFADPTASSPEAITKEVNTNLTAPMLICQTLIPHFLASEKPCSIIFISSAFAYVPVQLFPIYGPTKAGLHSFGVSLRAQLAGSNVTVTDLAPAYVDTELDIGHKERLTEMLGGADKVPKPTPLEEFLDDAMKELDALVDGKPKREIAIGHFPKMAQEAWRKAIGPLLEVFHVDG
ncbi:putative NADP(+)-dependent dehydrogenase [Stipitochalara longipes BDJ]|nr:putative NADP(+)-dependent dehydrogenase [Stipitochalara longipes BDJ]